MRPGPDYLKRVLAGSTFGLYMAHLLYFLNPQIEITPWRIIRASILYGITCGILFGSLLWLLRILRRKLFPIHARMGRRHGFGLTVAATFFSTMVFWLHTFVLRIYLPIGAVRILIKATNLIAFVAFLLLILWVIERNATVRVSRILTCVGAGLIAVSCVVLFLRRDRYQEESSNAPPIRIDAVTNKRPLLIVAIRDLPYDWLITLKGEERLNFFDRAIDHDFFARLEPFPTTSPKALWASLVTGKLPHRHGVTGRFSYESFFTGSGHDGRFLILPAGVGFRVWGLLPPVRRISAQLPSGDALPFWSAFERLGVQSSVIGWPSTNVRHNPASFMVTETFLRQGKGGNEITPVSRNAEIAALLRSPSSKDPSRFSQLPTPAASVARQALAFDLSAVAIARSELRESPRPLTVLSLGGFADVQNSVGIDSNRLPDATSSRGRVVRAYIEELDSLLGSIEQQFPEQTIIVVSPSGPSPPAIPAHPIAVAIKVMKDDDPGVEDGFVMIHGAGMRSRPNPQPARTVDIVPTMLFISGLPIARDMDGRILTEAFDDDFLRVHALSLIHTYEPEEAPLTSRGGRR
ncbi:MAG TPA: alkaline phosphatase family protein [Thermoanaerobaculia bacterium]|nr:alkaline phosphatase family protein [Thermoanaerobaculia bacterium]